MNNHFPFPSTCISCLLSEWVALEKKCTREQLFFRLQLFIWLLKNIHKLKTEKSHEKTCSWASRYFKFFVKLFLDCILSYKAPLHHLVKSSVLKTKTTNKQTTIKRDTILKNFWTNMLNWLKINKEIRSLSGSPSCFAHHQEVWAWWIYVILPLQRRVVQNIWDSAVYIQNSPSKSVFVLAVLAVLSEIKSKDHLLLFD